MPHGSILIRAAHAAQTTAILRAGKGENMRLGHTLRLALVGTLAVAGLAPVVALATVIQSADVTLVNSETGVPVTDAGVAVGTPIVAGDPTAIGSVWLLPGESISVGLTSFSYYVNGNFLFPGPLSYCPSSGYTCANYNAGDYYQFDNLNFSDPGASITNATLALTDAAYFGASSISFTADSVRIYVGNDTLGVLSPNSFGTITVDLTIGGGTSVPEPATGGLLALGAGLGWLGRRRPVR